MHVRVFVSFINISIKICSSSISSALLFQVKKSLLAAGHRERRNQHKHSLRRHQNKYVRYDQKEQLDELVFFFRPMDFALCLIAESAAIAFDPFISMEDRSKHFFSNIQKNKNLPIIINRN